jgi:alpha-L-fucosidase
VAQEIFHAFRNEGFMTGAYFSKADWHHPDYWSPLWATPNRNNNYDTDKYPEKWQSFKDFTYRQVEELMITMGPMDILWLDAGWVRPDSTINDEVRSWGFDIARWEQDIDIPRIAAMARRHQPGLIVVDRTVHGPYENYRTPEQQVPPGILPYPWETNLTMTQSWGHTFEPRYKTTKQLIHTLVDVVSKGGNFLLNVAPTPQGTFEEETYRRLAEIGDWMEINGEAIYGTRPFRVFGEGENVRFTWAKDGGAIFVIALEWPGVDLKVASLNSRDLPLDPGTQVTLLGHSGDLNWVQDGGALRVEIPPEARDAGPDTWVVKVGSVPMAREGG